MSTVFHVGFHKTGTTTLQPEFFPTVEGCAVLSPNHRVVGEEFHFLAHVGLAGRLPVVVSPMINRTLAPPTRRMVRVCNRLFIETDENPKPPLRRLSAGGRLQHKLMKVDPVWFPKMSRQLGRRDRVRASRFSDRYAGHNARLQRLTGLSLREYGYLVDDDFVHAAV